MKFLPSATVRYLFVGALNAVVGFLVILSLMVLGAGDIFANFLGYVVGLVFSFALNGLWTCGRSKLLFREDVPFLAVVGTAYTTNLASLHVVRDGFGWGSATGRLAGVLTYAIVGFFGMKYLAFRVH